MAEQNQLLGLEDLPVFDSYPFFRQPSQIAHDVPVFEIARITYKPTPRTNPPYSRQEILGVVGRSPESNLIYASREYMRRKTGELLAVWGSPAKPIEVFLINSYEILIPNAQLPTSIKERRI